MKGNRHFPQCGFSAQVVGILKELGADVRDGQRALRSRRSATASRSTRAGRPSRSSTSTASSSAAATSSRRCTPSGELQKMLGRRRRTPVAPPKITLDDRRREGDQGRRRGQRRASCASRSARSFQYELYFGPKKPGDLEVAVERRHDPLRRGEREARRRHRRSTWVETADGGAFKIDNPNEPARVKPLTADRAEGVARRRASRSSCSTCAREDERAIAKIDAARAARRRRARSTSLALDKTTPIVFQCHHGMRSRSAAERFLARRLHERLQPRRRHRRVVAEASTRRSRATDAP